MHAPNAHLVRMANDIANFFRSQGEERAVAGISNHVRLFWEPRMKKQIFEHLDHGGEGLAPLTLKALQKLKADMHGKSTAAEAAQALKEMAEVGPDLVRNGGGAGSAADTAAAAASAPSHAGSPPAAPSAPVKKKSGKGSRR